VGKTAAIDAIDVTRLDRLVEADAHEGPVYVPADDALYFTSLPHDGRVAIRRLDLSSLHVDTIREPANGANGMTLGLDGRLVVCEQGSLYQPARIACVDRRTGEAETLVDGWRGMPLNSPNDVIVRSDGTVWFTDPSYGFLQGFRPDPQVGDHVYRFHPGSGELRVVADGLDKPNGIAFSPDESVLYVTDSGANQEEGSYYPDRPHHVSAFDVVNGQLTGERVFAVVTPGFPDGIKCDAEGRVYASSFSGVQIFSPDGERIGEISLPGTVNFTFGGPDRDVLFISTDTAVWAATVEARGA
jgi:gluconolactonase